MKVSRIFTALLLTLAIVMMSSAAFAQKPPETAVLKATPGNVTFNHAAHAKTAKCADCHHAAKAEKAPTSKFEKCSDCHTKTVAAPMKSDAKTAMHKNCIDCHKAQGKGPQKCAECHKK